MLFHYSLVLLLLLNQVKGVQRSMSYFTVHRQYIRVNLSCTADHTHRHTLHYFCDFNDSFSVWYNSRYYIGAAYLCLFILWGQLQNHKSFWLQYYCAHCYMSNQITFYSNVCKCYNSLYYLYMVGVSNAHKDCIYLIEIQGEKTVIQWNIIANTNICKNIFINVSYSCDGSSIFLSYFSSHMILKSF